METVITVERVVKMFDAMKITKKCKAFLKKHNVPFCDDYRIYRKLGMIHCKAEDWRGPIELDGFPTFSMDDAIFVVIDSCLSEFYFQKELENRDNLQKIYPKGYGEYDPRKYAFEKVIEVFKDYSDAFYRKAIIKYTKCLNTNSHSKSRWVYDVKNESFVTLECIDCEKANLKEAEEDWRLSQGDFDDIKNHAFKKRYFKSDGDNDHKHCCFCWKKITDLEIGEEHDAFGYVTLSERGHEEWVCEECFEDFKARFNFKTDSE